MKHNLASFRYILKKLEMAFNCHFYYAFCNVKTLKTAKMPKNISLKNFNKISQTIPNMLK